MSYLYVLDLLVVGEHVPWSVRVNTPMVQRPLQDIGNDPTPAIFGPQRRTIIQPNSDKLFG